MITNFRLIAYLLIISILYPLLGISQNNYNYLPISKLGDKYYLAINDTILGRDILIVCRVSRPSSETPALNSGDLVNQKLIRFEKNIDGKIELKIINSTKLSTDSSENGLYKAMDRSNLLSTIDIFDINSALSRKNLNVIDFTTYINGQSDFIYFNDAGKSMFQGAITLDTEKSWIKSTHSYSNNTIINSVRNYALETVGKITLELSASMMLLSKKHMERRYFDPRVGYFNKEVVDYDSDPFRLTTTNIITKWRLEPRKEDLEKYYKGELVVPSKPIVFYIDPLMPAKWVPYIIKGVNDWQLAFQRAGFKNAIFARVAPTKLEDSTWSINDPRFSVIVYMPAQNKDASYSTIVDPRSGEILQCSIKWYHNILWELWDRYFFCTPVDYRAGEMEYEEKLMGELITSVLSHEIGHALGFPHNFAASSSVPVEKLRDKSWVEENGITPSIMDYARINYVAQPEDHIATRGLIPQIGEYDKWAIEWGYRFLNDSLQLAQKRTLLDNSIKLKEFDKKYAFSSEQPEVRTGDPSNQMEDVGDNAMKAGAYGIKNLKILVLDLLRYKAAMGTNNNAKDLYNSIKYKFLQYIQYVSSNIGAKSQLYSSTGLVYKTIPKETQAEALNFINNQVFSAPTWLNNINILERLNIDSVENIYDLQWHSLGYLLYYKKIENLVDAEIMEGKNAYTFANLLEGLRNSIWSILYATHKIPLYTMNLQNYYLNVLKELQTIKWSSYSNHLIISLTIKSEIAQIKFILLKVKLKGNGSDIEIKHIQKCLDLINKMEESD